MRASIRPEALSFSRGIYLPHVEAIGIPVFVTFRLSDALPARVLADLTPPPPGAPPLESRRYRKRVEDALDAGHGSCVLREPVVAEIVAKLIRSGAGREYELHAWCVMPNHVHVVMTLLPGALLSRVMRAWKGASSREINRLLGRDGALWQRDYYDRLIGSDRALARTVAYVERNPVEAGLVRRREDWAMSSARFSATGTSRGSLLDS